MLPKLFFGYFAVVMIALSILIITRKNPVHSVLLMLAMFFHIAAMYLFLNAEFLAAVQIILYAGAILVLFLFVIMMLNLKEEFVRTRYMHKWPLSAVLGASILVMIFFGVSNIAQGPAGTDSIEAIKAETQTKALGKLLFSEYLIPFEIIGIILTVALVGAFVLAKKRD